MTAQGPALTDTSGWRRLGREMGRIGEPRDANAPSPLRDTLTAILADIAQERRTVTAHLIREVDQRRATVRIRLNTTRVAALDNPRIAEGIGPMLAYAHDLEGERQALHAQLCSELDQLVNHAQACDAAWRLGCQEHHPNRLALTPTRFGVQPSLYDDFPDPFT